MLADASMESIVATMFSPFNFDDIVGFHNVFPTIDVWGDYLPWLRESREDNPSDHLIKFHECMDQLDIHLEDVRMNMFMYSLESNA